MRRSSRARGAGHVARVVVLRGGAGGAGSASSRRRSRRAGPTQQPDAEPGQGRAAEAADQVEAAERGRAAPSATTAGCGSRAAGGGRARRSQITPPQMIAKASSAAAEASATRVQSGSRRGGEAARQRGRGDRRRCRARCGGAPCRRRRQQAVARHRCRSGAVVVEQARTVEASASRRARLSGWRSQRQLRGRRSSDEDRGAGWSRASGPGRPVSTSAMAMKSRVQAPSATRRRARPRSAAIDPRRRGRRSRRCSKPRKAKTISAAPVVTPGPAEAAGAGRAGKTRALGHQRPPQLGVDGRDAGGDTISSTSTFSARDGVQQPALGDRRRRAAARRRRRRRRRACSSRRRWRRARRRRRRRGGGPQAGRSRARRPPAVPGT